VLTVPPESSKLKQRLKIKFSTNQVQKFMDYNYKTEETTTYIFRVVIEPDEDRWVAYCPALEEYAAASWGYTKEDALKNIQEVVEMIIEEMIEDGKPIPSLPQEEVQVFPEPKVMVAV
jgi:predicted RNase H-like HicB family nuclease